MEDKAPEKVLCPLVNRMIDAIDCIENVDVVNGLIKESCLPEEYKIENYKEICKACQWHEY